MMTSFMALDGVTSFLRLKVARNTRKRFWRSLSFGGKLEEAEDFKCVFVVYCVLESKPISSSAWIVESIVRR